ncbi:hypothetical protein ABTZ59_36890, partial [Streptomyces sp. NPDC094034]|uniref:hypothetical protein n=1 Tax=Streptomyces sp. NPDC094034 TaxID=3155309 RepID=UPI003323DFB1
RWNNSHSSSGTSRSTIPTQTGYRTSQMRWLLSTRWLREAWDGSDSDPFSTSHKARLDLLDSLRDANRSAARLLVCSLALEVAAVALLSLAVAVLLFQATT